MKIKSLLFLGSVIGGAAYLRDKGRRDAFFDKLARWKDQLPDRLTGRSGASTSGHDSDLGTSTTSSSTAGSYYGSEPTGRGVY